jgi:hypothetical protein
MAEFPRISVHTPEITVSQREFGEHSKARLQVIMDLLHEKGQQYSGGDNFAANFVSGAALLGIPKEQYLIALATKHILFVAEWAAGRRPGTHPALLAERINDITIYLQILQEMVELEAKNA